MELSTETQKELQLEKRLQRVNCQCEMSELEKNADRQS